MRLGCVSECCNGGRDEGDCGCDVVDGGSCICAGPNQGRAGGVRDYEGELQCGRGRWATRDGTAPAGKALVYFIQDMNVPGGQHFTVRMGVDGAWVGAYKQELSVQRGG